MTTTPITPVTGDELRYFLQNAPACTRQSLIKACGYDSGDPSADGVAFFQAVLDADAVDLLPEEAPDTQNSVNTLDQDIHKYGIISARMYMPWWAQHVLKNEEFALEKAKDCANEFDLYKSCYYRLMSTEYGTSAVYFIHQTVARIFAHYAARMYRFSEEEIFKGGEQCLHDLEENIFNHSQPSTVWMEQERKEAIPFADKVISNAISVLLTDIMQKYEHAAYALPEGYYQQEAKLAEDIHFFRNSKHSRYMVDLMIPAIQSFLFFSGLFHLDADPDGQYIIERFDELEQMHAATLA